jgi:peptide/nickel transport system permease protein
MELARKAAARAGEFVLLMLALATALFFLLRATGDPATLMAGQDADPETLAAVRERLGLDRPLLAQYLAYLGSLARLDFGPSIASGAPALSAVADAAPASILLAALAMLCATAIALPLGVWLGAAPDAPPQRAAGAVVYAMQGAPGYVVALVLVQIFAVGLGWLPSLGYGGPATFVLPTLALSAFLAPKLARVIAVNMSAALKSDYVRAARATGASEAYVLWREAAPNAVAGALALLGAQAAFLLSGAVVIETIFAWPGLGRLLARSALNLDFPVVQAAALTVGAIVFVVNRLTDVALTLVDPRLREPAR